MSLSPSQQKIIDRALSILADLYQREPLTATSPEQVKQYCQLQAGHLEHEVFGVFFLDNRNHLIKSELLFRGTVDGCSIPPREVVKSALMHNSAACIFFHNHPSNVVDPSSADSSFRRLSASVAVGPA